MAKKPHGTYTFTPTTDPGSPCDYWNPSTFDKTRLRCCEYLRSKYTTARFEHDWRAMRTISSQLRSNGCTRNEDWKTAVAGLEEEELNC